MPQITAALVKERVDILQMVSRTIELRKRGEYYVGLCPFHQEKTPSFHVRPNIKRFKCFGCGASGDVIEFLMLLRKQSFQEIIRDLGTEMGLAPNAPEEMKKSALEQDERQRLLHITHLMHGFFQKQLHDEPKNYPVLEYLAKARGLTPTMIRQAQLGFGGNNDQELFAFLKKNLVKRDDAALLGLVGTYQDRFFGYFTNRVIIPIRNMTGQVVAFGGRAYGEKQKERPKYVNSKSNLLFEKNKTLFGAYESCQSKGKSFVLVEGYFDAMALWAVGMPAVSVCGTALTKHHMNLLRRLSTSLIVFMDTDDAGKRAIFQMLPELLQAGFHIKLVKSQLKDASCYLEQNRLDELSNLCREANDALDYLISESAKSIGSDVQERIAAIDLMIPLLKSVPRKIARRQYIRKLAQAINEDENLILQEVERANSRTKQRKPEESPKKNVQKQTRNALLPTDRLLLQALLSKPVLIHGCQTDQLSGISRFLKDFLASAQKTVAGMPIEQVFVELMKMAKEFDPGIFSEAVNIYRQRLFLDETEASQVLDDLSQGDEKANCKQKIMMQRRALIEAEKAGDIGLVRSHLKEQSDLIAQLSSLRETGDRNGKAIPSATETKKTIPKFHEACLPNQDTAAALYKKSHKDVQLDEFNSFFDNDNPWD